MAKRTVKRANNRKVTSAVAAPKRPTAVVASEGRGGRPMIAPGDMVQLRELFWNNVIREILTSLSAMTIAALEASSAEGRAAELASAAGQARASEAAAAADEADPFDGRMAVILANGSRIPIAGVAPVFACGVPGTAGERSLSMAVECTVFHITTPAGEAYTLPLHEIRGFHSLTDELMAQLEHSAQQANAEQPETPFGFAAFTSLARGIPGGAQDKSRGGISSGEPAL